MYPVKSLPTVVDPPLDVSRTPSSDRGLPTTEYLRPSAADNYAAGQSAVQGREPAPLRSSPSLHVNLDHRLDRYSHDLGAS